MDHKKRTIIVALAAVASFAIVATAAAQAVHVEGSDSAKVGVQITLGARIDRANQEIDRRVAALNKLSARVQAMQKVSADAKSKTAAEVQAQINDLATLKAKIDADTDVNVLKTDVQSITASYRIFALVLPQGYILAAADRMEVIIASMRDLAAKMQTRINTDQSAGHNMSAAVSAMADLNTKLGDANIQAQGAGSLVYNLVPDQGDQAKATANHTALVKARGFIKDGTQTLQAARKDIKTILDSLKSVQVGASASSTTNVK